MNRALLKISLACLVDVRAAPAERELRAGIRGEQRWPASRATSGYSTSSSPTSGARSSPPATATTSKIAESRLNKGTGSYQRYYPYGKVYAPVTGYDSIYGSSGIEEAENSLLAGTSSQLAVHNFTALLTGKQKQGATVELTISPAAQEAAYKALATNAGGHAAGVVAINPSTGAILALAGYPTFNPNELTSLRRHDGGPERQEAAQAIRRSRCSTGPPR